MESGAIAPVLPTFQRMLAATGLWLVVVDNEGHIVQPMRDIEDVHNGGGCYYPAHLDTILDPRHGEWWGDQYGLARPPETFHRDRRRRDAQRARSVRSVREIWSYGLGDMSALGPDPDAEPPCDDRPDPTAEAYAPDRHRCPEDHGTAEDASPARHPATIADPNPAADPDTTPNRKPARHPETTTDPIPAGEPDATADPKRFWDPETAADPGLAPGPGPAADSPPDHDRGNQVPLRGHQLSTITSAPANATPGAPGIRADTETDVDPGSADDFDIQSMLPRTWPIGFRRKRIRR